MSTTHDEKVERVRLSIAVTCAAVAAALLASGTAFALGMWEPAGHDPGLLLYGGLVASIPAAFFGFRSLIWLLTPLMVMVFVMYVFLMAGLMPDGPLYAGADTAP